jgi:hypothetical protein
MGKIIPIKNHKNFNPKRNVKRISRPKIRLRGYSSQNDDKNCQFYISAFGRRYNEKFSKKEQEMILHIRDLFSDNGERTEYFSRSNTNNLIMENDNCNQPIILTYMDSLLIIYSLNGVITGKDDSVYERTLKYIETLNSGIPMGSFDYFPEGEIFLFKLVTPLYQKPKKEFMESILAYINDVLNKCIPKIHLHIYQLDIAKRED